MTATFEKPRGQARSTEEDTAEKKRLADEAEWQKQVQHREALTTAQSRNARRIKFDKMARRDPVFAALLEEYDAFKASLEQLRTQHAALETKHAEHLKSATGLAESHASLQQTLNGTTANLETAHQDLAAAGVKISGLENQVQQLGRELDTARSAAAKARQDLATALAKKK